MKISDFFWSAGMLSAARLPSLHTAIVTTPGGIVHAAGQGWLL